MVKQFEDGSEDFEVLSLLQWSLQPRRDVREIMLERKVGSLFLHVMMLIIFIIVFISFLNVHRPGIPTITTRLLLLGLFVQNLLLHPVPQVCNVFSLWQRRWLLLPIHLCWIMMIYIMAASFMFSYFRLSLIFTSILFLRAWYLLFTMMLLVFGFYLRILPMTWLSVSTRTSLWSYALRCFVGFDLLFLRSRLILFFVIVLIILLCSRFGTALCIDFSRIFNCCRI